MIASVDMCASVPRVSDRLLNFNLFYVVSVVHREMVFFGLMDSHCCIGC